MTAATAGRPQTHSSSGNLRFRFSDPNPLTGGTFAQSRFRDLPEQVAYVVTELHHLSEGIWDALVEDGEVYDYVGHATAYRVLGPEVFERVDEHGQRSAWLVGQAALDEWMCS